MPDFAYLRQSPTPEAVFTETTSLLRLARLWDESDGPIHHWVGPEGWNDARESFLRASDFVEQRRKDANQLVVIVDGMSPHELNPLVGGSWSSLVAMLVLAFPDVRWLFQRLAGFPIEEEEQDRKDWLTFEADHGLGSIHEKRGSPLFDGYGLRQWIIARIKESVTRHPAPTDALPVRTRLATVLDEEPNYHLFFAYMAYSRGFCVHAMASWSEVEQLLREGGRLTPGSNAFAQFDLSLEDWFLSFPDQSLKGMSDMDERSAALPGLVGNPMLVRRFITVGHQQQDQRARNRKTSMRELRSLESQATGRRIEKSTQVIHKPAYGFYTLWKELGMHEALRRVGERPKLHGLAEGYVWPPDEPASHLNADDDALVADHSSPGRLLQISEHLISRATSIIDSVNTVTEAVRGAVLATQALELLACKTPTVSVDALLLKHEFEVCAECQFVGVEYHLSMKERLADIRRNLEVMSQWLHKSRRAEFILNAEAKILTRLVATLDQYGEFEESQFCQRRLRTLHRQITHCHDMRQRPLFAIASWPFRAYIEFVLRSLGHYSLAIAVLTLVFTGLFMMALKCGFLDGLHRTMLAVFTVSFGEELPSLSERFITYAAAAAGVLNFGLLISYLYNKMLRR